MLIVPRMMRHGGGCTACAQRAWQQASLLPVPLCEQQRRWARCQSQPPLLRPRPRTLLASMRCMSSASSEAVGNWPSARSTARSSCRSIVPLPTVGWSGEIL